MPRICPKDVSENEWHQLPANRDIAVRLSPDDIVNLRFGQGQGVFVMIGPPPAKAEGRFVNTLHYETGDPIFVARLAERQKAVAGRTQDCPIKVMHAIVSRHHAELRFDGNVLVVRDLGSTNGTYCHTGNVCFDVQSYLADYPLDKAAERTLDELHEAFGPTLDDFLKRYSLEDKEK